MQAGCSQLRSIRANFAHPIRSVHHPMCYSSCAVLYCTLWCIWCPTLWGVWLYLALHCYPMEDIMASCREHYVVPFCTMSYRPYAAPTPPQAGCSKGQPGSVLCGTSYLVTEYSGVSPKPKFLFYQPPALCLYLPAHCQAPTRQLHAPGHSWMHSDWKRPPPVTRLEAINGKFSFCLGTAPKSEAGGRQPGPKWRGLDPT